LKRGGLFRAVKKRTENALFGFEDGAFGIEMLKDLPAPCSGI
jgi:hypothetical protein